MYTLTFDIYLNSNSNKDSEKKNQIQIWIKKLKANSNINSSVFDLFPTQVKGNGLLV